MIREKKFAFLILGFVVGCGAILLQSVFLGDSSKQVKGLGLSSEVESSQLSEFTRAKIFVTEGQEKKYRVVSEQLGLLPATKQFGRPRGVFFRESGPINFSSDIGRYDQRDERIDLYGAVDVKGGHSKVTSDQATLFQKKEEIGLKGSVNSFHLNTLTGDRVKIQADRARVWTSVQKARYQGNVKGKITRKRQYEGVITFKTDHFDINMVTQVGNLKGNVEIENEQFKANSFSGTIFFENYNKKLKYYSLNDDVRIEDYLVTREGKKIVRRGLCEKLEVFAAEQLAVLTGSPKVFQGADVVKGSQIVLRRDVDIVEVTDSSSIIEVKESGQ